MTMNTGTLLKQSMALFQDFATEGGDVTALTHYPAGFRPLSIGILGAPALTHFLKETAAARMP